MARERRRIGSGQALVGIGLIVLGVLLLLNQLGVASVGRMIGTLWPLVLVVPGVIGLVQTRGRSFGPLIPLALGVGFLLANLGVIGYDWLRYAWPLVPIVIGVYLLLGARRPPADESAERITVNAVFSGSQRCNISQSVTGGEITAVMGGTELDLSVARPADGSATSRLFIFMGGAEIMVPASWSVQLEGLPLLGGWEDSRTNPPAVGDRPDLRIIGTTVMGGFEVTEKREAGAADVGQGPPSG